MTSNKPKTNNSNNVKPNTRNGSSISPVKTATDTNTGDGSERKGIFSSKLIIAVLVALFFAFALFLRVYLPYHQVFTDVGIKFTSNDSYSFMRLVDNLTHNFPRHMRFDPFLIYPGTGGVVAINFFIWLLTVPAMIFGGAQNQYTLDTVDVYLPAIMGALCVIPVYFIGKELFNRWAGVLAAGLIAILPGEFLGRSILGFTDNHIAETLFTTVTMMFLIMAVKSANHGQIAFSHIKNRDWASLKKPLILSLLAGFSLGIYIFTWAGALLFVFLAFVFFVTQFIIDHLKRKSSDYLAFVGFVFFFVAMVMAMTIHSSYLYLASLFIAVLAMPALNWLSHLMSSKTDQALDSSRSKSADYISLIGIIVIFIALFVLMIQGHNPNYSIKLQQRLNTVFTMIALLVLPVMCVVYTLMTSKKNKPLFYPLALLGIGAITVGLLYTADRSLFNSMLTSFSIFQPTGASLTTIEMQPLVSSVYGNPLTIAWGNFNVGFFLTFISLVILVFTVIKQSTPEKCLVVVWSLIILVATLGQRRFGYYLAINVALLSGYFSWKLIELVGIKWLSSDNSGAQRRAAARRAKQNKRAFALTVNHFVVAVVVIIVFSVVYAPNILLPSWKNSPAVSVASAAPYAPSDAWVNALTWLKDNSPEPLGSDAAYYQVQQPGYTYPSSAYGVLSWWDYGAWITRIAHRIPNANPSQDPNAILNVANFLTAQDETEAEPFRQAMTSLYVVLDHETTLSKFWAIVTWANKAAFFDTYYVVQQQGQQPQPVILYYPDYYRSMGVRMFNFDGKAVTPDTIYAIAYSQNKANNGQSYKLITDVKQFTDYQAAQDFLSSGNQTGKYQIIGTSPLKSPVPLEAMTHYTRVYASDNNTIGLNDGTSIPSLKIFEYVK